MIAKTQNGLEGVSPNLHLADPFVIIQREQITMLKKSGNMSFIALSYLLRTAALPVVLSLALAAPVSAASVFDGFEGAWRGRGTISLSNGSREAIRCRAAYGLRGDGDVLSVDVNCASDSYRVHIVADAVARGSVFSGSWQETTRQVGGTVTGRIPAPGEMQASFEAMGGGLQLGAHTDGRRQAITIYSQGSDMQSVSISLKR